MEIIYNWILKLSFFAVLGSMILQMLPDHGFQKICPFRSGTDSDEQCWLFRYWNYWIREPHLKRFIMIVHIRFGPVNWKKKSQKSSGRYSRYRWTERRESKYRKIRDGARIQRIRYKIRTRQGVQMKMYRTGKSRWSRLKSAKESE